MVFNLNLAERIYNAFGSCSGLYECSNPDAMLEDFKKFQQGYCLKAGISPNGKKAIKEWIEIQLGVEDALGLGSEMILAIKGRLLGIKELYNQEFFNN